jgi:hypothetical protein
MLDDMHKRKIDMADEIFVINKDGYIGNSTKSEIQYAKSIGKNVRYLQPFNINNNINCIYCDCELLYHNNISQFEEIYKCPDCKREYVFDSETKEFDELV